MIRSVQVYVLDLWSVQVYVLYLVSTGLRSLSGQYRSTFLPSGRLVPHRFYLGHLTVIVQWRFTSTATEFSSQVN